MKARRVSETIARRIQRAISNGKLEPGEKLPAERDLAKKLSVSRVSVRVCQPLQSRATTAVSPRTDAGAA